MSEYQEIDQKLLQEDKENKSPQQFREYGYRWIILVLYILPNLLSAAMWITCSPISTQLQQIYPVSSLTVNFATLCFPILYLVVNFPSIFVLDDYGLRWGVTIGTILTIIGLWLRTLVNTSENGFIWVIVGQILGGIGQPFLLNCPAKIATFWFGQKSRVIVTGILALVNPIGVGVGFIFPGVMVSNDSNENEIFNMMLLEAIIFSILMLPTVIFFKGKPPQPPSLGAETKKMEFKESIFKLFKNKNFLLLFASFSMFLGNFNCLATLVGAYVQAFQFSPTQGSIFGAFVVLCGLIGGAVGSTIVQVTQKYKLVIMVYSVCCLGSFILLFGVLITKIYWISLICSGILGFFNITMIPLSVDFACEITFPMGEALTSGTLVTMGQFVSIIQVVIISIAFPSDENGLMTENQVLYANTIGIGMLVIGIIVNIFLKEDLRRINQEKQKQLEQTKQDDEQEENN